MPDARNLSAGQEALWFLHRLVPESAAYNVLVAVRIRGPLDLAALRAAVRVVAGRHDLIRSVFGEVDGVPRRVVRGPDSVRLEVRDVPDAAGVRLAALVREVYLTPFRLAETGPFRVTLLRRAPDEATLVLVAHHIATDATSQWLLLRDLLAAYRQRTADRQHAGAGAGAGAGPGPAGCYDDFVAAERRLLASPRRARLEEYWRGVCAGVTPAELPTDRPGQGLGQGQRPVPVPGRPGFGGATYELRLPDELTLRVQAAARAAGVTTYVFLLGAFQSLLCRYTGRADFTIGCPATARRGPGLRDVVGYLVNPLPLRASFDPDTTLAAAVRNAHRELLRGITHAGYPSALLPGTPEGGRSEGGRSRRAPLFRIAFNLVLADRVQPPLPMVAAGETVGAEIEYGGLRLALVDVPQQEGQIDLSVELLASGPSLKAMFRYDRHLFDHATMERFAGYFARVAELAVSDPDTRVARIPLLAGTELERLLAFGTGGG